MIAAPLALLALCGCHRPAAAPPGAGGATPAARPSESLYREPPSLVAATPQPGGGVALAGRADPGARVRLASPDGEQRFAETDGRGNWRLRLPPPGRARLFGLSMIEGGRVIQSEGYVLQTPRGAVAQLRAGAGALVLRARPRPAAPAGVSIAALDFDSKGGVVVSGEAAAGSVVDLWVDGVRRAGGSAAADGRFSVPLDEPLAPGAHTLAARDHDREARIVATIAPAAPLPGGPFRATAADPGWRIDWLTPGGGLQTTLLPNPPGAAS